ncbi:hypothetical protein [Pseudobacillus badius]|uniref:hypothetical protein n=1 Tax=Bacillus badius TaxID=1455 RepID=UPI003D33BACE
MKEVQKKRQTRSDKKRDIKPTIPVPLYETIHRISYLTARPIKEVVDDLCVIGLSHKQVLEHLSAFFRRDFWATPTLLYRGDQYIDKAYLPGEKRRISTRVIQRDHDRLAALAYAMDHTISYATALLLHATVKNSSIIDGYIVKYTENQLEPSKRKELQKILQFINENNPYDEEVTLSILINYLIDEVVNGTETVKEALGSWIDKKKQKTNEADNKKR